jgi:hypothetical protein
MTISRRSMGMVMGLGAGVLLAGLTAGCSSSPDGGGSGEEGVGMLSLPLATNGPSGARYRLRDATFQISNPYDWSYGGEGGASSSSRTVSSEDDPDADSISLSLEQGYYEVWLQPGWRMEKVEEGVASDVEATLLSGNGQWVYVSPRSTSWVEFQFGIGSRELWLNGDVNIGVTVHENPDDYYGGGGGYGAGGYYEEPGSAGAQGE